MNDEFESAFDLLEMIDASQPSSTIYSVDASEEMFKFFNLTDPASQDMFLSESVISTLDRNSRLVNIAFFSEDIMKKRVKHGSTLELILDDKRIQFAMDLNRNNVFNPISDLVFTDLTAEDLCPTFGFIFSVFIAVVNIVNAKSREGQDYRTITLTEITRFMSGYRYSGDNSSLIPVHDLRSGYFRQLIHLAMLYLDSSRIFYSYGDKTIVNSKADRFLHLDYSSSANSGWDPQTGLRAKAEVTYTLASNNPWFISDANANICLKLDYESDVERDSYRGQENKHVLSSFWNYVLRTIGSSVKFNPIIEIPIADENGVDIYVPCKLAILYYDTLYAKFGTLSLKDENRRKKERVVRSLIENHLKCLQAKGTIYKYIINKAGSRFSYISIFLKET